MTKSGRRRKTSRKSSKKQSKRVSRSNRRKSDGLHIKWNK